MRKFNEKLNVRFDKKVYVIEEEIHITGGKYEGFLKHDNVDVKSVNVYSGTKLTGDKINSFALSTDDDLSWRTYISIQSNLNKVYVSYETIGDTVEAEDVNELQEAIVEIDEDLQSYKKDNTAKVKQLRIDVDSLENRKAEKTYVDRELNNRYLKTQTYNKEEIDASLNLKADKVTMQNELNKRYTKSEVYTKSETQNKLDLKADKTTMQNELNNRYVKSEVYTKQETDTRIQNVIGSAPTALDTLQELANSLNNDANFASTMTKELAKKADKTSVNEEFAKRYTKSEVYTKQETQNKLDVKADKATIQNELNNRYVKSEVYTKQETQDKLNLKVDKISGKQLSTNDYTTVEKQKLAGIEQNANRYVHPATHTASMIVESSDKRFVSDLEKEKWNTVSNKLDSNNAEAGEVITTFTVASKRENIKSKEKLKLSFAKIAKYFNDLKLLAFTANWNDIVNKPSTFTPSSHSHVKADIADFAHTHTVNEITNFPNQDITDLKSNKHNHSNKSVLDKITQTILEHITSAYNHISDNIRHISNEERIKWNKVDNKIDTNVANSKFATKQEISSAGYGDMLKSIYDKNNNGQVDTSQMLNRIVTAINLNGQIQITSYRKSVIALCSLDNLNPNPNKDSASQGELYFKRSNGLDTIITVKVAMQKRYNSERMLTSYVVYGDNKVSVKACTFTYNGKKYGGIEFYYNAAEHSHVSFAGVTNFEIFGVDYYNTQNGTAINTEIGNSINYSSNIDNFGDVYINKNKVFHEGQLPNGVAIDTNNEINIANGFNQEYGQVYINFRGTKKAIKKYHLENGLSQHLLADLKIKNLEAENTYTKSETDNKFAILNRENIFTKSQSLSVNSSIKYHMSITGGNANGIEYFKLGGTKPLATSGLLTSSGVAQYYFIGFSHNAWAENAMLTVHPNGDVKAKGKLYSNNKEVALKEDFTRLGQYIEQEISAPLLLTKLKNVDGSNSGLDADKLDGLDSSAFSRSNHNHNTIYYTKSEIDNRIKKPLKWSDLKRGL